MIITPVLLSFLSGCSSEISSSNAAIAAKATDDIVYELVVNDHNPVSTGPAQSTIFWAKQIESVSGGRLKLTVYTDGYLLNGEEAFRGVKTGVCDITVYVMDKREGFTLNTVMSLPFMGWPEMAKTRLINMQLLQEFPAMQAEWEGVTILATKMNPPTHLHTSGKIVKTPADMQGLKLFCAEDALITIAKTAGAIPVDVDITEMTALLERELMEGVINHFPVCYIFKALDYLPYHTVFSDGGINMTQECLIMNNKRLDSLPSDLQALLLNSGDIWNNKFAEYDAADMEKALQFCKDRNHTFTRLTSEELIEWQNLIKVPIYDEWLKAANAKGQPAQAVFDRARELAAQSQYQH